MPTPEDVLAAQAASSSSNLILYTAIMILHGMTIDGGLGYTGLALPYHLQSSSHLLQLSEDEGSWYVLVTPLAQSLGVLVSISLSYCVGRKKIFILSYSFLGYIIIFATSSFWTLMAARVVQCFTTSLGEMIAVVFLSEISTVRLRGSIAGIYQLSVCFGILFYTALCMVLPIQFLSLALAGHSLVVALLVLLLLPDSPQWLVRHGRVEEARTSLQLLRGGVFRGSGYYRGLELEMEEFSQSSEEDRPLTKALFTRSFSIPMGICTFLFMALACCGNDTLIYYGPTIFSQIDIGLSSGLLATLPHIGFTSGYVISSPLMAR